MAQCQSTSTDKRRKLATYFSRIEINNSRGYAYTDWDNPNRSKFDEMHKVLYPVCKLIRSVRLHAERTNQLYIGDTVRVRNNYFDDEYAGRRFSYVSPSQLKDAFGNLVDVDPNCFVKIANGRKTEPHKWLGSDVYALCTTDPSYPLIDCLYEHNLITEDAIPILMQWVDNGAPFVL